MMKTTWMARTGAGLGLLALSAMALGRYGHARWSGATRLLVKRLEDSRLPPIAARYDERELDGLPAPVQRYFRAVLRNGQRIVTAVTIRHAGTFNLSAGGERWVKFSSRQRVTTRRPGFVWSARIQVAPGIHVAVQDAYVAGVGYLHAAVQGLFTLAKLQGEGELARGELARYLAEAAWYPTALLPSQGVRWAALDDRAAEATLVDGAVSLVARFEFDDAGRIEAVKVASRGAMVGDTMVMRPWGGRMSNYQTRNGMQLPLTCEAAWFSPGDRGPGSPYWRGTIMSIEHEFAA